MGSMGSNSISFLMGVEIYFKTAAKLVTPSTPAADIDR